MLEDTEWDWNSPPKVARQIKWLFALANSILRTFDRAEFNKLEGADDEVEAVIEKHNTLIEEIASKKGELQAHYRPFMSLFDYSFPSTIGDVSIDESSTSGRLAFYFFYELSLAVSHWCQQYVIVLKSRGSYAIGSPKWTKVQELNQRFPVSAKTRNHLHKRLAVEQSQVLRDLKDYCALHYDGDEINWLEISQLNEDWPNPDKQRKEQLRDRYSQVRRGKITLKFADLYEQTKELHAYALEDAWRKKETARRKTT